MRREVHGERIGLLGKDRMEGNRLPVEQTGRVGRQVGQGAPARCNAILLMLFQ
jgi:hypothetical protein